jgi:hypothetical protein
LKPEFQEYFVKTLGILLGCHAWPDSEINMLNKGQTETCAIAWVIKAWSNRSCRWHYAGQNNP